MLFKRRNIVALILSDHRQCLLQWRRISSVGLQRGQDARCDGTGDHCSRRHKTSYVFRIISFSFASKSSHPYVRCRSSEKKGPRSVSGVAQWEIRREISTGSADPPRARAVVALRRVKNSLDYLLTIRAILSSDQFSRITLSPTFCFTSDLHPFFLFRYFSVLIREESARDSLSDRIIMHTHSFYPRT